LVVAAILIGFSVASVQASFFEWAFHRFWLHRPWLPKGCFTAHTLVHHQLCKFDDTFHVEEEEQEEALTFQWWGGPLLIVLNLVPWLLVAWALTSLGASFPFLASLVAFGVTFVLYYVGYEGFHHLMHKPRFPFIERSQWFQFLKRHHRIHHIYMNRNLNVLLPLADLVFGTLVTKMPVPVATPDSARQVARRHSDFGKRIQGGGR